MSTKVRLILILLGAFAFAGVAFAATPQASKSPTAQQQKMGNCSHQSKGMKGAAHKKFMSDCMHGKSTTGTMSGKTMQQNRMKDCNVKAKGMKGPARKTFMSTCLKKS